jgi:hypothetical protein
MSIPSRAEDDRPDAPALTPDELTAEQVTELPDREAMSIIAIGDNVAVPINEANALNYYSSQSVAVADADQVVFIDQSDVDGTDTTDGTTDTVVRGKGGK